MELQTKTHRLFDIYPDIAREYAQKLHKKKEDIEFKQKFYVSDKAEKVESERAVISYITTGTLDRDHEILLPKGMRSERYEKSGKPVFWGHRYDEPKDVVGQCQWLKADKGEKGIIAKTAFRKNEFADEVYQLYTEDLTGQGPILRGFSVGFIPLDWEEGNGKDEPRRTYNEWELLEFSCVSIPCNPDAQTILNQKGIKLCDRLKKEIDEATGAEPVSGSAVPEVNRVVAEKDTSLPVTDDTPASEVVTKPETTDSYHRIPVSEGHEGHRIRTITISAEQGIKALFCGQCKEVVTYLFDVDKWTMAEAREWVDEHKEGKGIIVDKATISRPYVERWNKSLSKLFDVAAVNQPAATWELALCSKFLECEIKNIFQNNFLPPSPLLGTYLSAFKVVCANYKLLDTRNFDYSGHEYPPNYEVIQLNSTKSEDFLVEGTRFYKDVNGQFILRFTPTWMGIQTAVVTRADRREWNKALLNEIHAWVRKNNFLRGEIFALSGEFLPQTDDAWDNLILDARVKEPIQKTIAYFKKNGDTAASRGTLFIGPAGTGKTKTGRVMLNDPGHTFIWVSSRDFKKIDPTTALSLAFQLARSLAPTVLFIEDIDSWLRDYTVDLLKTEMDGLRQNKGILTVLTSNYPERLPDALLDRPGRFHHVLNFALPDVAQRRSMLKLWAGDIESTLLNEILTRTTGFSGAHMKELVDFAHIIADEDGINMGPALLRSLKQIEDQRELIDRIRQSESNPAQPKLNVKLEAIDAKQQAPAIEPKPIEPPPAAPLPAKRSFTAAEVQEFLKGPEMKAAVDEAIKVGLAKIRGKVI